LTDRTILVTGASSGIGRDVAIFCSELGAKVVLHGRDQARLEETRKAMTGDGHALEVFDLSQTPEVAKWTQGIVQRHGPLSGLVHSAAVQRTIPVRVISPKMLEESWATNVGAAMMMLKALSAPKAVKPGCSVVLISSSAAQSASPGNTVYAATKGAIDAVVRSLAIELMPAKIRVNCVQPAVVETPMVQRTREEYSKEMFNAVIARHPMGFGQPRDVSYAVAFLLADTARWITGTALVVDGGYTAM
jgi:NAD(P)-dependent dehydrogenase (short-subunit alcohol dehydrogenase family)